MESTGTQVVEPDFTAMTRRVERGNFSGELTLRPFSLASIEEVFEVCAPSLALALAKTDELTMNDLLEMLRKERATLLVEFLNMEPQGCCVTAVIEYPQYKALEILAIAGMPGKRIMYPNEASLENLKAWARILGCRRIQGYTNEAVGRLWARIGFKETSRKMEIKL